MSRGAGSTTETKETTICWGLQSIQDVSELGFPVMAIPSRQVIRSSEDIVGTLIGTKE